MGSDESRFNVSLIVRDKVTRQCPQTPTFEEKGEPKRIQTDVPLLTSLMPYHYAKPAHIRTAQNIQVLLEHWELGTRINPYCANISDEEQ